MSGLKVLMVTPIQEHEHFQIDRLEEWNSEIRNSEILQPESWPPGFKVHTTINSPFEMS